MQLFPTNQIYKNAHFRRGEMFYFMHKQMLSRYNVDRVALGLDFTKALSR